MVSERRSALPRGLAPILLGSLLLACAVTPAHGFDGRRQGFVLGATLGAGTTSFTQQLTFPGTDLPAERSGEVHEHGVVTGLRIGYGLDEHLVLSVEPLVDWFRTSDPVRREVTVSDGLAAATLSYYFHDGFPSLYVASGAGVAVWATPMESHTTRQLGGGLFVGGGWEFQHGLGAGLSYAFGWPSRTTQGVRLQTNTKTFRLALHATAY